MNCHVAKPDPIEMWIPRREGQNQQTKYYGSQSFTQIRWCLGIGSIGYGIHPAKYNLGKGLVRPLAVALLSFGKVFYECVLLAKYLTGLPTYKRLPYLTPTVLAGL